MTWPWTCLKMIRRNRYPTAQLIFLVDHNMVYNINDQLTAALGGCNTANQNMRGQLSNYGMTSSAEIATHCLPPQNISKRLCLQFLLARGQLPQHKVKGWKLQVFQIQSTVRSRRDKKGLCKSALQHEIKGYCLPDTKRVSSDFSFDSPASKLWLYAKMSVISL